MYQHNEHQMILPSDFFLPFGGSLDPDNRWVIMASLIPWAEVEEAYVQTLGDLNQGSDAFSARLALGSLIIKERLGLSDIDTVETIKENPYLQFFIGLQAFQQKAPFHPSLMTHFRKRFRAEMIQELNESIALAQLKQKKERKKDKDDDQPPGAEKPPLEETTASGSSDPKKTANQGKLLLDATCAPSDIAYPTDISLLNQSREKLEQMIDVLYAPLSGKHKKPRTYRKKAHKQYLSLSKQRKPGYEKIREGIKQQLGYIRRNLGHIERLVLESGLNLLSKRQYRDLLVIQELYRQQAAMYEENTHSIEDRIVSIEQPYIRPIVRGKAHAAVEFGAKLSVSLVDGFAFVDKLEWDAYNEGIFLQQSAEAYKDRFGCYPEAILADSIYRNRENRQYCKQRNIRLSGPKLGRPSKDREAEKEQKQIARLDYSERNAIEGKFGEGKRAGGLGLIQARLQETSETVISLQFLIMNIKKILRDSFLPIFVFVFRKKPFVPYSVLFSNVV